jgi:hypothetical protein
MLRFEVTDRINTCIKELLDCFSNSKNVNFSDDDKKEFQQILIGYKINDGKEEQSTNESSFKSNSTTISFDAIRKLAVLLKEIPEEKLTFPQSKWTHHLLEGSEVVPESKIKTNKERYDQFMMRARAKYSDIQYEQMTKNIVAEKKWNLGLSQLRDFNSQLSLGLNIIVTMGSAFAAGYFTFLYATGDQILVLSFIMFTFVFLFDYFLCYVIFALLTYLGTCCWCDCCNNYDVS